MACALAFASRAIVRLPGLAHLEGRIVPTTLAAIGLFFLRHPLAVLLRAGSRRDLHGVAASLDDRLDLKDQVATAVEIEPPRAPLDHALHRAATTALARYEPLLPSRRGFGGRWLPRLLAFLFAFLLLAPGVSGLLGVRGVGRGDAVGLGATDGPPTTGPGRLPADRWLRWCAQDPLPVEALPSRGRDGGAR